MLGKKLNYLQTPFFTQMITWKTMMKMIKAKMGHTNHG